MTAVLRRGRAERLAQGGAARTCEAVARRRDERGRRQRGRRRPARRRARPRARCSATRSPRRVARAARRAWTPTGTRSTRCARSAARGARRRWSSSASGTLTDDALEREIERAGGRDPRRQAADRRRRARQRAAQPRARRARALLAREGWMTFEAGAAEVNAGMTYVGELEGRMRHLVRDARRPRRGLDRPGVRAAALRRHVPPEPARRARPAAGGHGRRAHARRRDRSTPAPTSGWCARGRQVRDAFDVVRVEPMDEPRTLALAARKAP